MAITAAATAAAIELEIVITGQEGALLGGGDGATTPCVGGIAITFALLAAVDAPAGKAVSYVSCAETAVALRPDMATGTRAGVLLRCGPHARGLAIRKQGQQLITWAGRRVCVKARARVVPVLRLARPGRRGRCRLRRAMLRRCLAEGCRRRPHA